MARKKDEGAAVAATRADQPAPPPGCAFMWRADPTTGATQRAEVESVSGSVDVMAAQGWSLDPIKD